MAPKATKNEFILKAKSVHGDKYDYSQVVYINSKTPVTIICPTHGEFKQQPYKHLQHHGCPLCAKNHKMDTNTWIQKAIAVHGDKYDYSEVKYTRADEKVSIICKKCGTHFMQLAGNHLKGKGCPVCRYDTIKANNPMYSEDAREHLKDTMRKKYGASNIAQSDHYKKIYSLVKAKRLKSLCKNNTFVTSGQESKAYMILCDIFGKDDVVPQYHDNRYPFQCDFYIISRDMFVEFNVSWTHGGHWYDSLCLNDVDKVNLWSAKGTKYYRNAIDTWTKRDVNKRNTAREHGLNYLTFWKSDLSDFQEWINTGCPDGKDWNTIYSWKDVGNA